jgi:hypothetical protein
VVVALTGLLGAVPARADDKALAAEMKKLEGRWAPTENILDGAPTPGEVLRSRRTVVKGDAYENVLEGKVENKGTWKFVAKKDKVLRIDLMPTGGPGKGKVVMGTMSRVYPSGDTRDASGTPWTYCHRVASRVSSERSVPVLGRRLPPVPLDRVPVLAQPLLVRVPVLSDDGRLPVRTGEGQPEPDRRPVVEHVQGAPAEPDRAGTAS